MDRGVKLISQELQTEFQELNGTRTGNTFPRTNTKCPKLHGPGAQN